MTKDDDREPVTSTVTFLGYPFGGKGMWFQKGVESVPIPKTYAQLLRKKGLVPEAKELVTDKSTKADADERSKA